MPEGGAGAAAGAAPLGLAFAGMGGFAAPMTDLALAEPRVRVVAVGDPVAGAAASAGRVAALREAGVAVRDSFDEALARPGVEAAWLPVPIALHRPFAEAALAAGKHVLCEKPLAGCVADAAALVAAADASGCAAALGFHDLFDPEALAFKRAAHGPGGVGELESVTVVASWPRDDAYFRRNGWAGRIRQGGAHVRDSPANNALAHYLMLAQFFAGEADLVAATPVAAEARGFRAADIENFDTVSARLELGPGCVRPGVPLFVHLTHAAAESFEPQLLLRGSRGRWLWKFDATAAAFAPADRVAHSPGSVAVRGRLLPRFVDLCRGVDRPDAPYGTFAAGLAHAVAVELIQDSLGEPIPRAAHAENHAILSGTQRVVPGLLDAMKAAATEERLVDLQLLGA